MNTAAADIRSRLENAVAAQSAATKTHASVITFSDGTERRAEHMNQAAADLSLRSYRPLIGKHEYISRSTGQKITIVSCEVVAL